MWPARLVTTLTRGNSAQRARRALLDGWAASDDEGTHADGHAETARQFR